MADLVTSLQDKVLTGQKLKELRINTKVGELADFQPHVIPHDIRKSVKGQHDC